MNTNMIIGTDLTVVIGVLNFTLEKKRTIFVFKIEHFDQKQKSMDKKILPILQE